MLKILHPASYPAERAYIHMVLIKDFLGFDFEAIPSHHYGYTIQNKSDGYNRKINLPDVFFAKELGMPELPLRNWDLPSQLIKNSKLADTTSLPVIFGTNGTGKLLNQGDSLTLPIDIFGSAFFMLSRYEEVVNNNLDSHQRFPGSQSIAYKAGFLEQPIIDQYVELLWLTMKSLWPEIQRKETTGKTWVTCDVDVPFDTRFNSPGNIIRTLAGDALKRRSPNQFARSIKSVFKNIRGTYKDPYDTFDWYMDTCEKYGHKAAFYFIADHSAGKIDGSYSLNDPKVKALLKNIADRGHEIGLHGSYNTFNNPEQIKKERNRLLEACEKLGIDSKVEGNRQHFLRWDTGQTPDHLDEAGFEYDTTGSFADMPGFRYGTARPFKMWSWKKNSALALTQKPLIVMESSVIDERYLNLGYTPESINKILQIKRSSLSTGGNFTLLWHNSSFFKEMGVNFFIQTLR